MTFEAGPWHCFGNELLDRLHQFTDSAPRKAQRSQSPRNSQTALSPLTPAGVGEADLKKMMFVPDYTAIIKDDCTYLEISAQTYLLAFKSTLIKNRSDTQDPRDSVTELDGIARDADAIPLNKITKDGVLEEDVALVRTNGSLRRKNVGSVAVSSSREPC